MKEYASENLRNIAVVGHGKAGKSSLLDACLFDTGVSKRLGRVDEGTSQLDYEPEAIRRKLSVSNVLAACEWQGYKLNFIDTPGYPDFVGEVQTALQAADAALVVISAPAGIEAGTERAWRLASEIGLPRAIFMNKMDREHADFFSTVDELRVRFGSGVVPVQLPVGREAAFQGVVDLLALHVKVRTHAEEAVESEIPEYMQADVEHARQQLIEVLADYDGKLLEKYIDGQPITEAETAAALTAGIAAGKVFPVFCGSALQNIGVKKLLNDLAEYLPAPGFRAVLGTHPDTGEVVERQLTAPFSAQIFKTTVDSLAGRMSFLRVVSGTMRGDAFYYDVVRQETVRVGALYTMQGRRQENLHVVSAGDLVVAAKLSAVRTGDTLCDETAPILYDRVPYPAPMLEMAVRSKNKDHEDKTFAVLAKEQEADPTLQLVKNPDTKEMLLRGIGEVQLEVLAERLQRKFGVELVLQQPAVAYRETIRRSVKAEGKYKKQSGGHGQYGHVWLELSPQPAGAGNMFTETVFGGSVPRQYIPAVEKGTAETLAKGILAGYPMVDMKVNLVDGSYHPVDSSEMAFKAAAALALRRGVMEAEPVLLEPIEVMTVLAPEYYMGDVIANLKGKRARILGMESTGKDMSRLQAEIPAAELYKYATELRSLTQGRGTYTLAFSHYEAMPEKMAAAIIAGASSSQAAD
jgi:elongation factor G